MIANGYLRLDREEWIRVVEKRSAALQAARIPPTFPQEPVKTVSRLHGGPWVDVSTQVSARTTYDDARRNGWYGLITQRSRVQIPSPRRTKGRQAWPFRLTTSGNAAQVWAGPLTSRVRVKHLR